MVKFDFGIIHPFTGDVAIRLRSGGLTEKRYCARFPLGSAIQNTPTVFKAKDAPAPTACSPSGAFVDEGDGAF